jgi:ferrous iron transport protein B
LIWVGVVTIVLLVVGWLAALLIPGDRTPLLIELPPLRFPQMRNVFLKTLARLEWYLKEVIPLFLIGAAAMFAMDQLGILDFLGSAMEPLVVQWLGLPAESSSAFLMGFLRRDFGATGLFVMTAQGLLTPMQVVVSMVTITLFIPCVASVLIIAKEHGRRAATSMVLLIFPLAFFVSGILYRLLDWIGWML